MSRHLLPLRTSLSSFPRNLLLTPQNRGFKSSLPTLKHLGFIGLGQMGRPMALNLLNSLTSPTDTLTIYDVSADAVKGVISAASSLEGTTKGKGKLIPATSIEQVWDNADEIITMLPEPKHVLGVYEGFSKHAHSQGGKKYPPKLLLDSSTIDIPTCHTIATTLFPPSSGHVFLDAPVSGGVAAATKGSLTFMVGHPDPSESDSKNNSEIVARITTLLAPMGTTLHFCGAPTSGLASKLTNNYLLSISNIAVCEAMNLGLKLGLAPSVLTKVVNTSSGACWSSKVNNPLERISVESGGLGKGWEGGFKTGLMRKDLRLAREAAGKVGARLVLAERAGEVYRCVEEEEGTKGRDFSVVYRWLGGKE
ncbi:putative 3-hydroxyisobutyrate dehydrogenase G6G8.5 [Peziza echinospora]|nr:putative 3-hydroxyisobutyrate dehydrogenase G6G8.5 [Peziza echinospora]